MAFKIDRHFLSTLPNEPGVYIFKEEGRIIYVGKAKNIKKRVSSYFLKKHDLKTELLSKTVDNIDFIITGSEVDALILEDKLIKKYKPKFNIQLRDNKTYPYLAIDYNLSFPRVYKTRENHRKGVIYYGPFTDIETLNSFLKIAVDFFSLRVCKTKIGDKPKKVCLYYHIGKCPGYCTLSIDESIYLERLQKFKSLILGNRKNVLQELNEKMLEHAQKLEFEKAARIRDLIRFIEKIKSKTIVYFRLKKDIDVIGMFNSGDTFYISVLSFREGYIASKNIIKVKGIDLPDNDIVSQFISRYYIENSPAGIIMSRFEISKTVQKFLSSYHKRVVKIVKPKKSLKLVEIADKNAKHQFIIESNKIKNYKLKETLKLSKDPLTIECFDIATIEGRWTVGSSVRFYLDKPDKSNYRAYNLGDYSSPDDYEMIKILMLKRIGSKRDLPDLMIIDGGKGQLNAALEILNFFFIQIDIISIAKREESIYTKKDIIKLPISSLKLITSIRDEAHRFANVLHDKIRSKRLKYSLLESIKGIGKKRVKELYKKYGSIENILNKKPEDVSKETNIPIDIVKQVFSLYKK